MGDDRSAIEYGGALFSPRELGEDLWTYVALGHYHIAHEVRPRVWYAGSLDFVTTTPWAELRAAAKSGRDGKGYLLVDLPDGVPEFRRIGPVRAHIDLPPIRGEGLDAETLDTAIRHIVDGSKTPIDNCVARLVLWDVPRDVSRELNHARIRAYKARALHFKLDIRRPGPAGPIGVPGASRQTLPQVLEDYLTRRPLDTDVAREVFVKTGLEYLDQAMRPEGP